MSQDLSSWILYILLLRFMILEGSAAYLSLYQP